MRLSLFLVATAVLAAINVSAIPADIQEGKGHAGVTSVNVIKEAAHPIGSVEVTKNGVKTDTVASNDKVLKAASVNVKDTPVSKTVQVANEKLMTNISELDQYLRSHMQQAKTVEIANIMKNEDLPNPFSVLLVLFDITQKIQEEVKKQVINPLLPGSGASPFKIGFTDADVGQFTKDTMKLIDEAHNVVEEFQVRLQGKPTTIDFSSMKFLNPVELKLAMAKIAKMNKVKAECLKVSQSELPTTKLMNEYADKITAETKFILNSVQEAVAAAHPNQAATAVSDVEFDKFDDINSAAPTTVVVAKRHNVTELNTKECANTFDASMGTTQDIDKVENSHQVMNPRSNMDAAGDVEKATESDHMKENMTEKKIKANANASKSKAIKAIPSDLSDSFSEYDDGMNSASPTGF
ncbi:hypothetical protein Unana1_05180 [Umbelopsis nana]